MSDPIEQGPAPNTPDPLPPQSVSLPPAPVSVAPLGLSSRPPAGRPSFLFFGLVAAISLVADVTSKAWAEIVLSKRTLLDPAIILIPDHLSLTLAYNKGGAWGLLQNSSEIVRRPFFLLVSGLAIAFIVSLYGRLVVGQRALKWGLPLVLGGALGNLSDRIIRSSVIDFIDFRANWIEAMNHGIGKIANGWGITDHWPTFNVADVSICVGVGLMALDMFLSKRGQEAGRGNASGRLAPEPVLSASGSSKPPAA
jgi:signal peptidase II